MSMIQNELYVSMSRVRSYGSDFGSISASVLVSGSYLFVNRPIARIPYEHLPSLPGLTVLSGASTQHSAFGYVLG